MKKNRILALFGTLLFLVFIFANNADAQTPSVCSGKPWYVPSIADPSAGKCPEGETQVPQVASGCPSGMDLVGCGKAGLSANVPVFGCCKALPSAGPQCTPPAERKNTCAAASNDQSLSYECLPIAQEPKCTSVGGTMQLAGSAYPGCGSTDRCCVSSVCSAPATTPGTTDSAPKPVPQTGSTAEWNYGGNSGGLKLVTCTKSGDCTIQDMVQQGIYFADFLIGLSGALFLIAFIWGGTMYLLSFGRDSWVTKGRDAMVKSAIGIVFIMLAWTIVTYVASSLGYTKI